MEWLPKAPSDFNNQLRSFQDEEQAENILLKLATFRLSLNQVIKLAKVIKDYRGNEGLKSFVKFNLGVVANSTTSFLIDALIVAAARRGISLSVFESPYNQVMQIALGHNDPFKGVELDAILLFVDHKGFPSISIPWKFGEDIKAPNEALAYLSNIRSKLTEKYNAPCIVQTCAQEPESLFGSYEAMVHNTSRHTINKFNLLLANDVIGTGDYLLDVSAIAETIGLSNWHDPVMYNMAKLPFSQLALPLYADHVCRIISTVKGKSRRALILDLDNTLWGGVVGDDGLSGISLGHGDSVGEAFLAIQKTILKLYERGIILAISSKNDDAIARSVFREHPDILLNEEHFAVFQANWKDKPSNIEAIANELNLGLDAFVFVDDNPMERDLVRKYLPEVAVPELPTDPSLIPRTLLAAGYFEAVHFSAEDKNRAKDYRANAKRVALREQSKNIDAYLYNLDMKASIQPFNYDGLPRITQLISKSNQFNLTTRRYSENQLKEIMTNKKSYLTLQVRLTDIFNDNGMVSTIICKKNTCEWSVDVWIMSCRVLGRKLEEVVFYHLVHMAKAKGVKKILGTFIPTERNKLVQDHYLKLGFEKNNTNNSEGVSWSLNLDNIKDIPSLPIKVN
jgi:FkbH-like protein